ncbi:MAG: helix-turn-helix domain-containing protein [Firmicutes bacterium]|nr:helix-turn-helix domain-containing protein [Bacillota bacterium]
MTSEEHLKIISQRIKELRIEKGVAVYKMAQDLKIGHASIQGWEKGVTGITSYTLVKLAKYFGVTTDYLVGLSDS